MRSKTGSDKSGATSDITVKGSILVIFALRKGNFTLVELHRIFESVVERIADKCVANRDLVTPRNALDKVAQITQVQVVTCIESQATLTSSLGSSDIGRNGNLTLGSIACGISLGIELYTVCATRLGTTHHIGQRVHKYRGADAARAELGAHLGKELAIGKRIPTRIGGDGIHSIGHQRNLCRAHLANQLHKRGYRIALDIELSREQRAQIAHIGIAYMSLIRAWMDRDSLASEGLDIECCTHHIGQISATRIANNGYLVNIYTQLCHKIVIFASTKVIIKFDTPKMKIILFSRPQPLRSAEELQELLDAIEHYKLDFAVNEEFAQMIERVLSRAIPSEKRYGQTIGKQPAECVMVCYGGDGTLLEGIHRLDGAPVPVVGINSGHLGFLATAPKGSIDLIFNEISSGNLKIEQRTMLALEGLPDGKTRYALNEVAVQRLDATMINIKTHIDNQMTAAYFGNGVILSTPTGSTAYSLSAGGPIVTPACNCLVLSPLTPHNLTMRPLVIPDSSIVRFEVDTRGRSASISLDNRTYEIEENTSLTVRRAERVVFLAVPHNISFYDTLRNKMMWGVDVR